MMSFSEAVDYYTAQAVRQGWWAHAQQRVKAMDSDDCGLWRGLHFAVALRVKATGYRPHVSELGDWWNVKSAAQIPEVTDGRRVLAKGWA